jgi:hypothetical protein
MKHNDITIALANVTKKYEIHHEKPTLVEQFVKGRNEKRKKIYCYVDETGQDTAGKMFIVVVCIVEQDKEAIEKKVLDIEKESGKKTQKWRQASHTSRHQYLKKIVFANELLFSVYISAFTKTREYDLAAILGIGKAIHFHKKDNLEVAALIYVDGLQASKRLFYGSQLRKLGINVKKVQGVRRDESNVFIRVSDAFAGFVRDARDSEEFQKLLNSAKSKGILYEL